MVYDLVSDIANFDSSEVSRAIDYVEKCREILKSEGIEALLQFVENSNDS